MVDKALAASPGDVEEAWEQSSSAAFCSITCKGSAGQQQTGQRSICLCRIGGIQLEKDISASERCDLGQATSLTNHKYPKSPCEPHHSTDPL